MRCGRMRVRLNGPPGTAVPVREGGLATPQRMTTARRGMIGFDIAWMRTRSGPRTRGYLVNALRKPIGANAKRTDFALAA